MQFIGSSQGRHPSKRTLEQRPEGSEEGASRICEAGTIQGAESKGPVMGVSLGVEEEEGSGVEREGRADEHGGGEKPPLALCLLFEYSMLWSFPWPLHLELLCPHLPGTQSYQPLSLSAAP